MTCRRSNMKSKTSSGSRVSRKLVAIQLKAKVITFALLSLGLQAVNAGSLVEKNGDLQPKTNSNVNVVKYVELSEPQMDSPKEIAFSPNGKLLAVRGGKRSIHVWNWLEKKLIATLEIPEGANDALTSRTIEFSIQGDYLAACHGRSRDENAVVSVWNVKDWQRMTKVVEPDPGSGCTAIGFTPTGGELVRLLFRPPTRPEPNLYEHRVSDWRVAVASNTGDLWGKALALAPAQKTELAVFGTVLHMANRTSAERINGMEKTGIKGENVLTIIDRSTRKAIFSIKAELSASFLSRVAWHPSGQFLSVASGRGLETFDTTTGEQVSFLPPSFDTARVTIHYTDDGRYLIDSYAGEDGGLRIWTSDRAHLLQWVPSNIYATAVTKDSKFIAVATPKAVAIYEIR